MQSVSYILLKLDEQSNRYMFLSVSFCRKFQKLCDLGITVIICCLLHIISL